MSEQYRKSNYCRAEAQYAFQKQLHIVPILLQKHYKPDGWLAFLVGSVLYVDFTKYEYSKAFELLINELKMIKLRDKMSNETIQIKQNSISSVIHNERLKILLGDTNLINKISINTIPLGDITNIVVGIKPYQVNKGHPKQTRDIVVSRKFDRDTKLNHYYKQYL